MNQALDSKCKCYRLKENPEVELVLPGLFSDGSHAFCQQSRVRVPQRERWLWLRQLPNQRLFLPGVWLWWTGMSCQFIFYLQFLYLCQKELADNKNACSVSVTGSFPASRCTCIQVFLCVCAHMQLSCAGTVGVFHYCTALMTCWRCIIPKPQQEPVAHCGCFCLMYFSLQYLKQIRWPSNTEFI